MPTTAERQKVASKTVRTALNMGAAADKKKTKASVATEKGKGKMRDPALAPALSPAPAPALAQGPYLGTWGPYSGPGGHVSGIWGPYLGQRAIKRAIVYSPSPSPRADP